MREKRKKTLLVALDGNKVIGFTGPIHRQDNGRGYFAGIGIHSDYRGRVLGLYYLVSYVWNLKILV